MVRFDFIKKAIQKTLEKTTALSSLKVRSLF
jgi:hypothetical protein